MMDKKLILFLIQFLFIFRNSDAEGKYNLSQDYLRILSNVHFYMMNSFIFMLMILEKDISRNNNQLIISFLKPTFTKKNIVLDFGQCGKSGTPRESLSINPIGKWPWMASLGVNFINIFSAALNSF